MFPRYLRLFSLIPFALALGCGGGAGGGGTRATDPTNGITIVWPARNRSISAPSIAEEATIRINFAKPDGGDIEMDVQRPSTGAETVQSYPLTLSAKAGTYQMDIEFRTADGPQQGIVGRAGVDIAIGEDGRLTRSDGRPLGKILLAGLIKDLRLPAEQWFGQGETKPIFVSATTDNGGFVAVPPESVKFRIVHGSAIRLNTDGTATGLSEGQSEVVATFDGLQSQTVQMACSGAALASRSIGLEAEDMVYDPNRASLWVAVASGAENPGVHEIDSTGTLRQTLEVGNSPSALAISDDAKALFVGLHNDHGFRRVDLSNLSIGDAVYGRTFLGDRAYPIAMAVQPGSNTTVAVAVAPVDISGTGGNLAIFDDGNMRSALAESGFATSVSWASHSRILAEVATSPSVFYGYSVDAQGVHQAFEQHSNSPYTVDGFAVEGGRAYLNDRSIRDAGSFSSLGQFGDTNVKGNLAAMAGPLLHNGLAYYVLSSTGYQRLMVYRTSDRSLAYARPLTDFPSWFDEDLKPRLVRWGQNGLAVSTDQHLFLIDDVPGL